MQENALFYTIKKWKADFHKFCICFMFASIFSMFVTKSAILSNQIVWARLPDGEIFLLLQCLVITGVFLLHFNQYWNYMYCDFVLRIFSCYNLSMTVIINNRKKHSRHQIRWGTSKGLNTTHSLLERSFTYLDTVHRQVCAIQVLGMYSKVLWFLEYWSHICSSLIKMR